MDPSGEEKAALDLESRKTQLFREKMKKLAECDKIVSAETVNAIGEVTKDIEMTEDNVPSSDEFDEELEEEYRNLNDIFDLPHDTYSLTEITPELPLCVKYGIRSGVTHLNMPQFSPLSRSYQVSYMIFMRVSMMKIISKISFCFSILKQ